MKTTLIFAICMLFALFGYAQNETFISPNNPEEIKVTPPVFTGTLYNVEAENAENISAISKFLKDNIQYPEEAIAYNIQGTEVIQLTIDRKGKITDYKIINSVNPYIDQEMIRVLSFTNGLWKPGFNNDEPVEMSKEVSLTFCMENLKNRTVHEVFMNKATNYFNKAGVALFVNQNVKKALRYYDNGVKLLPYDKSLLMLRGVCRYELGDRDGAMKDWNRMTSLGETIEMSDYTALLQGMKGYDELMAIMKK